ncbi:hypothetical protein [Aquibacillus kalidii]|uniref:hypothetical protein n=1 Tax=Aquibacillus kalidii TaxID=2762597 RepID=UPI001647C01E|nr:hypothetical protein [Aquibacillus kalidii]
MIRLAKKRNIVYLILIFIILTANYLLYHLPILGVLPDNVVVGSIIDLLIVIPLLSYFLIIRNKYSIKYVAIAVLAGYGAAKLIIPHAHLSQVDFLLYLVLVPEVIVLFVELFILFKLIKTLPILINKFKSLKMTNPFFKMNLQDAIETTHHGNRLLSILATEISLFYYAIFSWRKNIQITNGECFTYHKKTSTIAVHIMLLHAIVLETIAFHLLIHQWNPYVSYVLLLVNGYSILFILAEIQAIRLTPFWLTNKKLYLYVGQTKGMTIPLTEISEIKEYQGLAKLSKADTKTVFKATVADMELEPSKPQLEVILNNPIKLYLMYGMTRKVDRVLLNVDDPKKFIDKIKQYINL